MRFVTPETFLVGFTSTNIEGLNGYLEATGNESFQDSIEAARREGISEGEILCSFYAKMCYQSLTLGHNSNVTRVRDIKANLESCLEVGHGSVFEHAYLNFVTSNCSRVLTHELVRHRVGTAYSQQSGRYCRIDDLKFVLPPDLEPVRDLIAEHISSTERLVGQMEERLGLNDDGVDFATKKRLTSAIRRVAPNGQANEMGWSVNLRSLRHIIEMRTSRHAEWEIRVVFNQVADIIKQRWPHILHGAQTESVDGLVEYSNLRV